MIFFEKKKKKKTMFLGRNEILFYNTGPNKSINNKQYPPISNIFLSQNIANNVEKNRNHYVTNMRWLVGLKFDGSIFFRRNKFLTLARDRYGTIPDWYSDSHHSPSVRGVEWT